MTWNAAPSGSASWLAPALGLAMAASLVSGLLLAGHVPAQLPAALAAGGAGTTQHQAAADAYGQLPVSFVPNAGQTDPSVRYTAQAGGASFWFTATEAGFSFAGED